jgi:hypothetical protein
LTVASFSVNAFARLFLTILTINFGLLHAAFAADATPHSTIDDIRTYDAKHNGFKWTPLAAAPAIQAYLKKRDPNLYADAMEEIKNVDVAVKDLDLDQKNDLVLYFHSMNYCGTLGCSFFVVPGEFRKKIFSFNAHGADPIRRGIRGDDKPYYF